MRSPSFFCLPLCILNTAIVLMEILPIIEVSSSPLSLSSSSATTTTSNSTSSYFFSPEICSELKCRNRGIEHGELGYSCWVDLNSTSTTTSTSTTFALATCAKGYVGVALTSVDLWIRGGGVDVLQYYTCCKENKADEYQNTQYYHNASYSTTTTTNLQFMPFPYFSSEVLSQCSTTLEPCNDNHGDCFADGPLERMSCKDSQNQKFIYPQKTGYTEYRPSWVFSQYTCCLIQIENGEEHKETILIHEWVRFILGTIAMCFSGILLLGILCSSGSAKYQAFNLYMLFLSIPDIIGQLSTAVLPGAYTLFSVNGRMPTTWDCYAYNFGSFFYGTANLWLNAVVIYEVHILLQHSKQRKHYIKPPSAKRACLQAFGLYILSTGVGIISIFVVCINHGDKNAYIKEITLWLCTLLPPYLYVGYMVCKIWLCGNLLPRNGRTRVLTLYILRVVTMFLLFWTTMAILLIMGPQITGMQYIASTIISFQGIIHVLFSLSKPDIRLAIKNFITCKWWCWHHTTSSDSHHSSHSMIRNNNIEEGQQTRGRRTSRRLSFAGHQEHDYAFYGPLAQLFSFYLPSTELNNRPDNNEMSSTNSRHITVVTPAAVQQAIIPDDEATNKPPSGSEQPRPTATTTREDPEKGTLPASSSSSLGKLQDQPPVANFDKSDVLVEDDDEDPEEVIDFTATSSETTPGLFDSVIPGGIWDEEDIWDLSARSQMSSTSETVFRSRLSDETSANIPTQ